MQRFTVPVTITLFARDAQHAQNKVAFSSLTSLEIPGLIHITVGDPTAVARKGQSPTPDSDNSAHTRR